MWEPRVFFINRLARRERKRELGQGDRRGGGPKAHATEGNAGPVHMSAYSQSSTDRSIYKSTQSKTPPCPTPLRRPHPKSVAPPPSVLTPLLPHSFCLLRRLICFHTPKGQMFCPKTASLFSAFAGLSPAKVHFLTPKQR
jgi:hypothetical protein